MSRRWWIAALAAFVVLAVAGVAYLYFRQFEPDRARYPVRGIDVSHHQGRIDWASAARDDVAFAYIKVSEGGDHRDREAARNIEAATKVGLPVGVYHFFTLCRPGVDQAKNFLAAAAHDATTLPPMVDLEFHGNCDRRPSPEELARELAAFADVVESSLQRTLIYYMPDDFLEAYGEAVPPRQLWRRSILQEPDGADWIIWQYHPAGRVAGIEGDVDLNVLSGSLDELIGVN